MLATLSRITNLAKFPHEFALTRKISARNFAVTFLATCSTNVIFVGIGSFKSVEDLLLVQGWSLFVKARCGREWIIVADSGKADSLWSCGMWCRLLPSKLGRREPRVLRNPRTRLLHERTSYGTTAVRYMPRG